MTFSQSSALARLLHCVPLTDQQQYLLRVLSVPEELSQLSCRQPGGSVPAPVIAAALNLLLFADLMNRVPTGRRYVEDCAARGRKVVFDHGAVRTVDLAGMGTLPPGENAITRILRPLGYERSGVYPLDRLGMTGRSYTHRALPESLPQFFVSELHVERFSPPFQAAAAEVTAGSRDPLGASHQRLLAELAANAALPFAAAFELLPALLACFGRQHPVPAWAHYERLLAESAEMAWICTEGNAFNHATDRVPSIERVVEEQRRLHRPIKDVIETSRSGRVRQTAFIADTVEREFLDARGAVISRRVPGSFYEFIQRETVRDERGTQRLDLSFDSGNAQGIFRMTAAA